MKNSKSISPYQKKTILVLIHQYWSEVDWILPVLLELKTQWRIVVLFSHQWTAIQEKLIDNDVLEMELKKIADKIIYLGNDFMLQESQVLLSVIGNEDVRVVLTLPMTSLLTESVFTIFPEAKIILFPHGPRIFINQVFSSYRNHNLWEKLHFNHDLILDDYQMSVARTNQYMYDAKICIVGTARHDKKWVDILLSNEIFHNSEEIKYAKKFKKVYLFIDTGIHGYIGMTPIDIFSYVFRSVLNVVFKEKDSCLLIKPHPSQRMSYDLYNSEIKKYGERAMISNLHVMQLSSIADMVISLNSSAILDVLAVGKPVIEFQPLCQIAESVNINCNGRLLSTTSYLGLTPHALSKDDLEILLHNYFNENASNPIWKRQQDSFRSLCSLNNNASQKAANVISYFGGLETVLNDRPNIQYAWSPLSGEKKIFLKKDNNQHLLHLELKRLKASGMPVSSILLRELKQIFNIDIFVITGSVNEYLEMAQEATKIFKEVHFVEMAADLYQIKSMGEINTYNNLNIYKSSSTLDMILKKIKGRVLFWLSPHEGTGLTFKTKTTTPILEELSVIRKHNIDDSVILINNILHFQPIIKTYYTPEKSRQYLSISKLMKEFQLFNVDYDFFVLGNISIAFPSGSPVKYSHGILACTLSRCFSKNEISDLELEETENIISYKLSENEKKAIHYLPDDYVGIEEGGVGGHFFYWSGLVFLGEKQYQKANKQFINATRKGFDNWRIRYLIALSGYLSGNIGVSKTIVRDLIIEKSNYKPLLQLAQKLNIDVSDIVPPQT